MKAKEKSADKTKEILNVISKNVKGLPQIGGGNGYSSDIRVE